METFLILLQGFMVMGLIAVGVHYKGMAIGLFGAVGVLAFALVFQIAPGSVPLSAMLIIMTVVTAAGAMQLAGNWLLPPVRCQRLLPLWWACLPRWVSKLPTFWPLPCLLLLWLLWLQLSS